ncbi:MAG: SURF1 family protein [Candidimonas sp.]|nr:MAG: SURF1 family protein [Candidimonas sp.]TAM19145.1 MAG: SURF1 family protein [Candidimonas sp.]TAM76581.1 MAG: SURF1 family protein [Candidimonas sp.]
MTACAFAAFILLGNWQLRRLSWKLKLIHDVATRVHAPPAAAPGPAAWQRIEDGHLQYLHVRLRGHFLTAKQTLVHGASSKGYGYWVMVPFKTDHGFIALINRGYIPPDLVETSGYAKASAPDGKVVVTGLLRFTEPRGGFLRRNHPDANQWYSRDVAAIAKADDLPAGQVAPYFVDADANANPGGWPVGGLTKIHFRNDHLGYAITWYLMALATLLGAGIMIRHEWRIRHPSR